LGRHKKPETIKREHDREIRRARIEAKKKEKEIRRSERQKKTQKKLLSKNSKLEIKDAEVTILCDYCLKQKLNYEVTLDDSFIAKNICEDCKDKREQLGPKKFKGQLNLF